MADGQVTEVAVREALATFQDPETGRPVTGLDQIHELRLEGTKLSITLGLTTWAAPFWETTRCELTELLQKRFPALEVAVTVAEHHRPPEKLGEIGLAAKSVIAVGSGKGGVGKSSISVALAHGLSRKGCRVGLMDADVYGPSIPHLLGSDERPTMTGEKISPVVVDGLKVMSMGFLVPVEEAVIWRGPMLHGALTQFLRDTDWGDLDYLIIDMPPGTGDIALSLSQLLPLTGAVVVCTPQDVALLDAIKAITMYRKVDINVLGMVENMSFFLCPDCDNRHDIFGSGGAKSKAAEMGIPFLGEVPLNTRLRILADQGKLGDLFVEDGAKPYLEAICENLVRNLIAQHRQQPAMPSLSILKQ
ncbi:MAG TPA: Mrp/NBP35 family ATP-binding protein [Thermoguttaceae bacterium]|nr:Mrp/NBP35 family ATP-binding protein [Thermoguttaceae bacterium]